MRINCNEVDIRGIEFKIRHWEQFTDYDSEDFESLECVGGRNPLDSTWDAYDRAVLSQWDVRVPTSVVHRFSGLSKDACEEALQNWVSLGHAVETPQRCMAFFRQKHLALQCSTRFSCR